MKQERVEMTCLLFSRRCVCGQLFQRAWLPEYADALTAANADTTPDQAFGMTFADTGSFPGAPAEYDIPVMPGRL
jgi:hypothetical protein